MDGLLKYFKRIEPKKSEKIDAVLPKTDGPLSTLMLTSVIQAANQAVRATLLDSESPVTETDGGNDCTTKRRGNYQFFSPKEKAELGKRAAEYGITSTIRYFVKVDCQERPLSPSTLFAWKEHYLKELAKRKHDEVPEVKELTPKKRGRLLLLGAELDAKVQQYIKEMRKNGVVINTSVVMAAAEGIVMHHDANLLAKNEGPIVISKHWARALLTRMCFVKRRGNTKAKVGVPEFEQLKAQLAYDVKAIIEFGDIPDSLVINWDHTAVNYIPVSSWTMEEHGSKRVEIAGMNKRQITMVLAVSKNGYYLPPQLIYTGKTYRCLPKVSFPTGWHITCTENHWANEVTTLQYIDKILLPYVTKTRKEQNLPPNQCCIVIFDRFKAQCTTTVLQVLEENILVALIPPHYTDRLQPSDIAVNKSVKEFLRGEFHNWYSKLVCKQL